VPKYLVLYKSSVPPLEQMGADPEATQAGMELWMSWAGRVGTSMLDMGAPVSPVATVNESGTADGGPASGVCGFSVLEADSVEGVKKLLDDHPHFHSPGDSSIEVLEFLAIPGM
jgi:hypothetical protein